MSTAELAAQAEAEDYAAWFRALADGTRVKIVSLLARHDRPMKVAEIVAAVQVGQSTVSQHLKVLAAVRFVLAERRGTARYYRINSACVNSFPTAAALVRGLAAPLPEHPGQEFLPPLPPFPGSAELPEPICLAIRPMLPVDADQVLVAYQAGLDAGDASFETAAGSWAAFDAARLPEHRYVATADDTSELLGWVAVSPVSSRSAYAGVVEHSVYVTPEARGRGVGAALLQALIDSTEAAGIWTIQSGIFPENTASLRLHERKGFRVVGVRERIGCHHGRWRDVVLVERRSGIAGN
ncbi:MAG TPA: metalloregulator ArsR/SmtB family transcription factor [Streptosporangiaceae bacterium]|jgi:phosphinothricin acetyltransferase